MSATQRIIPIVPVAAPGIEPATRIHPRSVQGAFARWRWAVVALTQAVFYGLPWLSWGGEQAVLFDLQARRFHLFGAVLLPQDLVLLTGVLVFSALLLFAATAVAGRVWCGFACPQTVYTSMFMAIERRFEGDRRARQKLDAAPWHREKLARRGGKHLAWVLLSLATGFSLVGWFTPVRELAAALPALALGPWEWFWLLFYATATYVHAGILREKICQQACPYARFQGSMLDPATRVIAYDAPRGEPRGARPRGTDARTLGHGDCVDCTLCVQVCPVGIDIRQGLQAACISCGLCIDACNGVMDKLKAPRGLIRFQPLDAARAGASVWRRPRVLVYAAALLAVATAVGWGWATRPGLRLDVLRDRAVLTRQAEDGAIENVYRLQLANATLRPRTLVVSARLPDAPGAPVQVVQEHAPALEPAGNALAVVTLRLPAEAAWALPGSARARPVVFTVQDDLGSAEARSTFILP